MESMKKKKGGVAAFLIDPAHRRTFALLCALCVLCVIAYRLYHPVDPLAELKRTEQTSLQPEAREVIAQALEAIKKEDMRALYRLMRVHDSTAFQVNYTDGIFAASRGAFMPAGIVGDPKRLVHSSWENLFVRLHSEPRKEDYWISLVKCNGRYAVTEIVPAAACGNL